MKTLNEEIRKNLNIMSPHSRRLAMKHLCYRNYDLGEYLMELANKTESSNLIREGFYISSVNECLEYSLGEKIYYFEKISGKYRFG